jgi:hypothetical protein
MFSVEELNAFCNTTSVFILQLGVRSNQSFLEDNTDSRSSCSMHLQQQIGRWKANLILELSFGIYNCQNECQKTKQKLELSKKLEIFQN